MNIVIISGNFLSKKGGISTTLRNLIAKLTEVGENIFILDNSLSKQSDYKVFYTKESFKKFFSQDFKFYIFIIILFFRILLFEKVEFKDRIRIAFFYCFYPKNLVNRIKSLKNLIPYFKNINLDIIFCISSSFPLICGFIISKIFKKPLVTYAHGNDFITRYPLNINTIIFQNIDKILVNNSIMKRLFLKIHDIDKKKVEIINHGVNIDKINVNETKTELRNKFNISLNDFIVLTISRIYPRKGIDTVIYALKLIIEENPKIPIKYYIIGDGTELNRLKKLVSELKLNSVIKFLGMVDDNIRNQYYKLSDVFILVPEIRKNSIEGFGLVFIEASYFKLPVIGSRSGGVKTAVQDGKTGFLIKPKDIESLKQTILLLYNNKSLAQRLGRDGHNYVIQNFNWNNFALIYKQILGKVIKEYHSDQKHYTF